LDVLGLAVYSEPNVPADIDWTFGGIKYGTTNVTQRLYYQYRVDYQGWTETTISHSVGKNTDLYKEVSIGIANVKTITVGGSAGVGGNYGPLEGGASLQIGGTWSQTGQYAEIVTLKQAADPNKAWQGVVLIAHGDIYERSIVQYFNGDKWIDSNSGWSAAVSIGSGYFGRVTGEKYYYTE
jgi:hypothetical protein